MSHPSPTRPLIPYSLLQMVEIIRSPQASGTPQLGSTTTATGRVGGRTSTVSTLTRNSSIRDSEYNNRALDKVRKRGLKSSLMFLDCS